MGTMVKKKSQKKPSAAVGRVSRSSRGEKRSHAAAAADDDHVARGDGSDDVGRDEIVGWSAIPGTKLHVDIANVDEGGAISAAGGKGKSGGKRGNKRSRPRDD
eukprot:scaffold1069_cov105-Alexandrium_tamarense.AAC.1